MRIAKTKLEHYQHICQEIKELEEEKANLASGRISGLNPTSARHATGWHSDPTAETTERLWALSSALATRLNELIALRTEIEEAIATLSPEERRIIRLHYVEGRTFEEVAEKIGYSVRHLLRKRRQIEENFLE